MGYSVAKNSLSSEDRAILSKLSIKQLQSNAEVSDKYLKSLLDLGNALLDNEKEWFLIQNEPDAMQLAKKHYAFRQNVMIFNKFLRILKHSQEELNVRENNRKK